MNALGRHLLVELFECEKDLNEESFLKPILVAAAEEAGAQVLESSFHKFSPYGVSGVVIIAESHLSIHTWPEYHYAAVDVFTCGPYLEPEAAVSYLKDKLGAKKFSVIEVRRGILDVTSSFIPHKKTVDSR